jgi:hypothetical protein
MKVTTRAECGNSPKNQRVEALTIALAKGSRRALWKLLDVEVGWRVAGGPVFHGIETVAQVAEQGGIAELTIDTVITHGRSGAVNGTRRMTDGREISFCFVFAFTSAKGDRVAQIVEYRVDAKDGGWQTADGR